MRIRRHQIRALATKVLSDFGVSKAPVPVEDLARKLNVEVRSQTGPADISGFLMRERNKGSAIIGVNDAHHPNRKRFTVAHELGHFLLHDHEDMHVDRSASFHVMLRDAQSSTGESPIEREANLFAAELLMPLEFLMRDVERDMPMNLGDEDGIKALAEKYKVSMQAMSIRLASLGFAL